MQRANTSHTDSDTDEGETKEDAVVSDRRFDTTLLIFMYMAYSALLSFHRQASPDLSLPNGPSPTRMEAVPGNVATGTVTFPASDR